MSISNKLAVAALAATAFGASAGDLATVPSYPIKSIYDGTGSVVVTPRGNVITAFKKSSSIQTCRDNVAETISKTKPAVDDVVATLQKPEIVKTIRELGPVYKELADNTSTALLSYKFAATQCAAVGAVSPEQAKTAGRIVEAQNTRLTNAVDAALAPLTPK